MFQVILKQTNIKTNLKRYELILKRSISLLLFCAFCGYIAYQSTYIGFLILAFFVLHWIFLLSISKLAAIAEKTVQPVLNCNDKKQIGQAFEMTLWLCGWSFIGWFVNGNESVTELLSDKTAISVTVSFISPSSAFVLTGLLWVYTFGRLKRQAYLRASRSDQSETDGLQRSSRRVGRK
ncbi:MAG: hypothetical protein AAGC79_00105 [Pseudomonadota bacterium]